MSIEEEDKFLAKLLSKEEEDRVRSSSSRVYYCGGASVPFKWESRPGTPKHSLFSESSRPTLPLTPPPSYYTTNKNASIKRMDSKQNQHSLIDSLNLRNSKKKQKQKNRKFSSSFSWSPTTSLSSSSSSSSFSLSPVSKRAAKTRLYYGEDEIGGGGGDSSPKTPLCFGSRYNTDSRGSFGNSMGRVKKALFSVLGH